MAKETIVWNPKDQASSAWAPQREYSPGYPNPPLRPDDPDFPIPPLRDCRGLIDGTR